MTHRRIASLAFLFVPLSLLACNRAQRTPIRETSLESVLEESPPVAQSGIGTGINAAVAPDCNALGRRITHCLGPAGGNVRIGPLGAVVGTSDGMLMLEVPAAALPAAVTVQIAPTAAPPWTAGFASHVYDFSPEVEFTIPVRLTLAYRSEDLPEGVPEARVSLYTVEDGAWTRNRESLIDARQHTVTAPLDRLRTAGALGPLTALTVLSPRWILAVGDSQVFTAATVPEGRNVSWAVSPRTVASIDSRTGRLTGLAAGHVRVVASGGGLHRAVGVEIVPAPAGPCR
jgi:Bacterial Ig-like domain (group 2)